MSEDPGNQSVTTPVTPQIRTFRRRGSRLGDLPVRVQRTRHPRRVKFSIHTELVEAARFRDREKMGLVMGGDRVNQVGLRHVDQGYYQKFRYDPPCHGSYTLTFPTVAMANVLLPGDRLTQDPGFELDEASGTLWLMLPRGQSLNGLRGYFDYAWPDLESFVTRWVWENSELPKVGRWSGRWHGGTYCLESCERADSSKVPRRVDLEVPDDLLQDPIRNGSPCKEHGFNPWNEDQTQRISAHLLEITRRSTEVDDGVAPSSLNSARPVAAGEGSGSL